MGLSCSCHSDYDWFFDIEEEERIAVSQSKCYGCGKKVEIGDEIRLIWHYELDEDGDETNAEILGRICEVCCGLFDRLTELKFCLEAEPGFIAEAMREYREMLPQKHIMRKA
jgi:hypothetical protein